MTRKTYTHALGDKTLTVELNNWAQQAHGSVLVRLGDTTVLVTAVMSKNPREGGDFFPLTVEYEEKYYAAGKILGSRFVKRETRPSEEAVLAGRLIDRAIRPRFDMRMRNEVQIVTTVLAIDEQNDPDMVALFGASLALSLSDIPWDGPVAAVRVGKAVSSEGAADKPGFILNSSFEDRGVDRVDIIIAGTRERINMMEAGAPEIGEDEFADAIEWGFEYVKELIHFQDEIVKENGTSKHEVKLFQTPEELKNLIREEFFARIAEAVYNPHAATDGEGKRRRLYAALNDIKEEWMTTAQERYPDIFNKAAADMLFEEQINDVVHERIIEKNDRPDGRKPDDLRPLHASIGMIPRVHGTGLFMRGETHVLSMLTLGAPGDEQIIEGMEIRTKRHFLHHYNFPPFSTGETKPMRGPGRREIGHGALASRALLPLLPKREDFPYTIRIVSEVLSSNGSSSMASVCGSSLALMDGGVPLKKPAAGAAMGLMLNEKGEYKVLTDIQGPEDHHGDMDFKVAGTRDGITAVQMDVKIEGITPAMLRDALTQAHQARMQILDAMEAVISEPKPELSPWAPRIVVLKINPEKIGALIGPGGKMINEIIAETGVQIDIEDDGTVFVTSDNEDAMQKALSLVKQVTREIKPGEILEGRVTRLFEFGAMVEIGPRQEGLIHISELAPWRVDKVNDILNVGDLVPVKVKNIDEQGRVNLSLKDVPGRYTSEQVEQARLRQDYGGQARRNRPEREEFDRNSRDRRPRR